MKCKTCGYETKTDYKFCPRCGAHAEPEELTVCPACGNVFSSEFEVCPACGNICLAPRMASVLSFSEKSVKQLDAESVLGPQSEEYFGSADHEAVPVSEATVVPAETPGLVVQTPLPPEGFPAPAAVYVGGLFDRSEVLLDEKVSAFKFANAFKIYGPEGDLIGAVQQANVSAGAKAARVLLGSKTKSMQKFRYDILDADGTLLATVLRDGGAFSQVRIEDGSGNVLGSFVRGSVVTPSGEVLCKIKSDWKLWNITMLDGAGNQVGEIHKRWNGLAKEVFTTADKYQVKVYPSVVGNARTAIFATALVYDILLHEY